MRSSSVAGEVGADACVTRCVGAPRERRSRVVLPWEYRGRRPRRRTRQWAEGIWPGRWRSRRWTQLLRASPDGGQAGDRRRELTEWLHHRGLVLCSDSFLCGAYIQHGGGVPEYIVDIMELMKWLRVHTGYPSQLDGISRDARREAYGCEGVNWDGRVHFTGTDRRAFSQQAMRAVLHKLVHYAEHREPLMRMPRFLFRQLPIEHTVKELGDRLLQEYPRHPDWFLQAGGLATT